MQSLEPTPKGKSCKVFHASFDVRLPKTENSRSDEQIDTVFQSDITVVCDPSKLDRRGCVGTPDLIIEILSPSTSAQDVKDKFASYEESGVQENLHVYPGESVLEVFKLDKDRKYQLDKIYTGEDALEVGIFDDFSIALSEVFEEESGE